MELVIFARFHALDGQEAAVAAALQEQVPAARANRVVWRLPPFVPSAIRGWFGHPTGIRGSDRPRSLTSRRLSHDRGVAGIWKMCGFYAPERKHVQLSAAASASLV